MSGHRQCSADRQAQTGVRARIAGFAYAALLPPAAFAVHQLRYWLAFGSNAGIELQRTGHSYLHSVVPWVVLLLALAVGGFLRALGRAFAAQTSPAGFTLSLTACGSCVRPRWSRYSPARSSSRACSRPGTRRDGWGSSVTGAGGRSRRRCASAWCWRRCCTGPAGLCARSHAGERDRIWLLPDERCTWRVHAMRCSCPRRRWSAAGRVGVRRRSVKTRWLAGAGPVADCAFPVTSPVRRVLVALASRVFWVGLPAIDKGVNGS